MKFSKDKNNVGHKKTFCEFKLVYIEDHSFRTNTDIGWSQIDLVIRSISGVLFMSKYYCFNSVTKLYKTNKQIYL